MRVPDDYESPKVPLRQRLPKNFWKLVEYAMLLGIVLLAVVFVL